MSGPSPEQLKKYKTAYEAIYNKDISEQDAFEQFMHFTNLVTALRDIYGPQYISQGYIQAIEELAAHPEKLPDLVSQLDELKKKAKHDTQQRASKGLKV